VRTLTDDLGYAVRLPEQVARVVSLVPSLTEAVAATAPAVLVGATDYCTHPADLGVARVRGTKNPDLGSVAALRPDLVIAAKEENRELDVRRLRERGVPVWVTDIETVPGAVASMRRLFRDGLGMPTDPAWLTEAERLWGGAVPPPRARVAVAVWRDPWMLVGRPTFTADVLARLGLGVWTGGVAGRYPRVDLADLDRAAADGGPEAVVLPDEPYVFTAEDGPEAFVAVPTRLVSGRLLTWYGPSLVTARGILRDALADVG
jgi:ABC-type Fe3+-hydroxamate transport system substrate-binding protein